MASAAEVQASIAQAFDTYITELAQAGAVWEKKPAGAAGGEAAWCAREVAEHIASSGPFFGAGIAAAIGVAGPVPARISLESVDTAVAETRRTHGLLMEVVAQVRDDQVDQEIDHPRLGKNTVGGFLGMVTYHLNDHAQQLKTLRG
ncbi:MAG: DinB family protein [Chloroflexi bacterium]|nr:DinB family protein [Dehalococcoidia bacterium]MCO5200797.1 DinB family protein [Chloroflexota bacterium]MCZ7578653.1 DinB family protein [Dehalococcoidia bacterium]